MARAPEHLTAELSELALRAIRESFDDLNVTFFRGTLKRPVFALSDSESQLGAWRSRSRQLEISRHLLERHGWGAVVEVLKHEMAHQFVDEVLQIRDESAHGPAFRQVCRERQFDARATGLPASGQGDSARGKVLERVAKLLSLAQSDNEHEAQAAAAAAQRIMLKYNLEVLETGRPSYGFRHLGKPTGRVDEALRILGAIIDEFYFVEAIWVPVWRPLEGRRGSVLEVCGSQENLELTEYVYHFLLNASERLWKQYRREQGLPGNGPRRTFIAGVMAGFRDKLAKERRRAKREGLVWVGDPELMGYMRSRHPRVRSVRYQGRRRSDAYDQGRSAGSRLVLNRGVGQGASRARPLLPAPERD